MEVTRLDYAQTNAFSKTVIDYLADDPALQPFYSYPTNSSVIPEIIANINQSNKVDRSILSKALQKQYADYTPNLKVVHNIDALADENTFTITTAHQLNLFTGPLYYIFKILNTIRVANDLKTQFPEYNFVPCYWMGSEDHDFEEVNHTYVFNNKIVWDNNQGGSLGEYKTTGIEVLIDELKAIIRQGDFLDDLAASLKRAYNQTNLAKAVRVMLDELFGQYGLVVVDGNCRTLKAPFAAIIKDELQYQTTAKLVGEQIEKLAAEGYKSQATPRPINLFYKTKHSRIRIVKTENGFELADGSQSFSEAEMLQLVDEHPKRFSPNVNLRPLHQQFILPNIAYIGGGSEVAYWLQLKSQFDHYQVHFPQLLLRTSAQILSPNQLKRLSKLNIESVAIFKDVVELKQDFVKNQNQIDLNLTEEIKNIQTFYEQLSSKANQIDASLKNFVGAEGQKALKGIENISKRLIKSEKQRHEISMEQIEKLSNNLFPNQKPQERQANFSPFYARKGNTFFTELLEILNPYEKKFYIVADN